MLCPYYNNSCPKSSCHDNLMIKAQKCKKVQETLNMSEEELDKYIPINELKHNHTYLIDGRNCHVGIWDRNEIGFHYRRYKFGHTFMDIEYHWDIGTIKPEDESYGTVKPIREIEPAPTFIDASKMMEYLYEHSKRISNEVKE